MKKLLASLLVLTLLTGCGNSAGIGNGGVEEKVSNLSFYNFETSLNDMYPIIETTDPLAVMINAIEGKKYKTENFTVELYLYADDSETLETAKKEGYVEMGSFGQFPVFVNGNYVMFDKDIPDDVIELFKNM